MFAVLGSSGYVGSYFRGLLTQEGIPWKGIPRGDLYDSDRLRLALREAGATFVINCAGYTGKPNVDACELHKTECLLGNGVLPGMVRVVCESLDLPWGHVSSGCIFTGRRSDGEGFTEEDPPNFSFRQNNCSFYSGTKALGEELLQGADRCYIWRLRIPFEHTANPRNYLQKVMTYHTLLEAENSLSQLEEFVRACVDSYRLQIPYGIYNMTNPGSIRTSEVVELIREVGVSRKDFRFFNNEAEFMQLAAKTPRSNCVLDCSKALAAGLKLTPIRQALRQSLERWTTQAAGKGC